MRRQYLVQMVVGGVLVLGMPLLSSQVWADDTAQLKQQVQALQDRVNQLESQLSNKQQSTSPQAVPPYVGYYDQSQDPFMQMMQMREQMDRNMRQAFANTEAFSPRMDMKQSDKEYIITMDIPGMNKDKINVEIKQNMLIISGERQSETEDKNNQYYQQGRSFGTFMQAIPLPEDARKDQIDAKYENGVLIVKVQRDNKEKKNEAEKIKVN